ncbi:putative reverse transcriptase domain-containing protein [Tanacetum coccineum]
MGQIMPPRAMTQAAIEKLVSDRVAAALAQDRATRGNTNGAGGPGCNIGENAGGQGGAPPARECTYSSFMKCNPTSFHGNEGAVELSRWFEKTESVFSISECAERNKKVGEKQQQQQQQPEKLPEQQCHNQNNNQRHGKAKALTTTQNAGANQTGVASKCNRCRICHFGQCLPKCYNCRKMGHKEKDCKSKNVASSINARSAVVCYECGERGHKSNACPKRADRQGGNVRGQAYVIRDAEHN